MHSAILSGMICVLSLAGAKQDALTVSLPLTELRLGMAAQDLPRLYAHQQVAGRLRHLGMDGLNEDRVLFGVAGATVAGIKTVDGQVSEFSLYYSGRARRAAQRFLIELGLMERRDREWPRVVWRPIEREGKKLEISVYPHQDDAAPLCVRVRIEPVQFYLDRHAVTPAIAEAMRKGRLVPGMTIEQGKVAIDGTAEQVGVSRFGKRYRWTVHEFRQVMLRGADGGLSMSRVRQHVRTVYTETRDRRILSVQRYPAGPRKGPAAISP